MTLVFIIAYIILAQVTVQYIRNKLPEVGETKEDKEKLVKNYS